MFTIKIVTTHGHSSDPSATFDEQVFEASGVRKEGSKVYVDLDSGCAEYDTSVGQTGREDVMYVMNRFGSTVATYRL